MQKRGGKRKAKMSSNGQIRALIILWRRFGGFTNAAKLIGVPKQRLINWNHRGSVPLDMVGRVSRKLNVSRNLLNYEEVYYFNGNAPGSWETIIDCHQFFTKPDKEFILKGKAPEVDRKLL